jgi:hypothetical protein
MARLRTPGWTTAVREYLSILRIWLNLAVEHHAIGNGHGAARQAGAGAARHDLHLQRVAGLHDGDDLRLVLGQHHHHGQLAVGGQAVAFVGRVSSSSNSTQCAGTTRRRASTTSRWRAGAKDGWAGAFMLDLGGKLGRRAWTSSLHPVLRLTLSRLLSARMGRAFSVRQV